MVVGGAVVAAVVVVARGTEVARGADVVAWIGAGVESMAGRADAPALAGVGVVVTGPAMTEVGTGACAFRTARAYPSRICSCVS